MPITINDIAQITGLNKSTISRALNDNPRISKQTIEKVKKVANDLGFEKNNNARSLST
ncbi:MAG: LacI family transcriptional regulator, partial [Spirochaetia bacterium]|nr:LacI family transcriptional regulator [Spirochaetia bacterium]